jgi:hypothetical protein
MAGLPMKLSHRIILIDSSGQVLRMPNSRFERLLRPRPTDRFPQFAGQRVRVAEVIVGLENRRPVDIVRISYFYLHFDKKGFADYETFMRHGALAMEAATGSQWLFPDETTNVIPAGHRFAARRRDHEAVWKPTSSLARSIYKAALDDPEYPRLSSIR